MRIISQPLPGGLELCARLGLLLVPGLKFGDRIIHAVLADSPGGRAGLEPRDILIAIDKTRWDSIRSLTFSDRRPSELNVTAFIARYFTVARVTVSVPPEPYRPIEDIVIEAMQAAASLPATPNKITYVNPRFEWLAALRPRGRRRRT
jgi:membrane-associated protease RseP (regulator of RpoE activity)